MSIKQFSYFLISLLFLNACKVQTTSTSNNEGSDAVELLPTQVVSENKISTSEYRGSREQEFDLIHTKLEVSFDWEKEHLNGVAFLHLKPHFYSKDTLVLDAKSFMIHETVLQEGLDEHELNYLYDTEKLKLILPREYNRDEQFVIRIKYTAMPNERQAGGSRAITSDKGLYFINADGQDPYTPQQIWTQGETEASSCWFPTIDAPNQRCTQEIYIKVNDKYKTLSNGILKHSQFNPEDSTRTDYWKMDKPHAPYLFMMAIGEFAKVDDSWNDMEVSYYVEEKYREHAKAIFGHTPEMIQFFSDKLDYKYPWPKYSQVVVREFVSGAMENTTASLFMEQLQVTKQELIDDHWDDIIAHELFHQWFGDLVTCESWANLTLNEAFATYSEFLWREHKYGRNDADNHLWEERHSYMAEAEDEKKDLIRFYYEDKEDMFDNHSYAKGGLILHMLRKTIGDEAFFSSLNSYLKDNAYKAVEVHHLRLAVEKVTGRDMNWFFNQWFLAAGHPVIEFEYYFQADQNKLKIITKQSQDAKSYDNYTLPLTLDIYVGNAKITKQIVINQKQQIFDFDVPSPPTLVVPDPLNELLVEWRYNLSSQQYLFLFQKSENVAKRIEALDYFEQQPYDSIKGQIITLALKDSFWHIREQALMLIDKLEGNQAEKFIKQVKSLLTDPNSIVRAEAINVLYTFGKDENVDVYVNALKDSSYAVLATAMYALFDTEYTRKDSVAGLFYEVDNINIVVTLASYYAGEGNASVYPWFETKLNTNDHQTLWYLTRFFGQYLLIQENDVQQKGIALLQSMAENSRDENVRLSAYQGLEYLVDVEGIKDILARIRDKETDEQLRKIYDKGQ